MGCGGGGKEERMKEIKKGRKREAEREKERGGNSCQHMNRSLLVWKSWYI